MNLFHARAIVAGLPDKLRDLVTRKAFVLMSLYADVSRVECYEMAEDHFVEKWGTDVKSVKDMLAGLKRSAKKLKDDAAMTSLYYEKVVSLCESLDRWEKLVKSMTDDQPGY